MVGPGSSRGWAAAAAFLALLAASSARASYSTDGLELAVETITNFLQNPPPQPDTPTAKGGDEGFTAILGTLEDGGGVYANGILQPPTTRHLRLQRGRNALEACYPAAVGEGGIDVYQRGWANWFGTVETYAPVFRPKTEKELANIVTTAAASDADCRVRVAGSTHSENGLVMQRAEENVLIVTMADFKPQTAGWAAPSFDKKTGLLRLHAGQAWVEAVPLYRPWGYVLRERTAAPLFTVGGVIANMAHGGSNAGGFIHSDVTKLLVMLSDGTVTEVEGDDLNYWRSSYGQLGIILAAELQLVSEADGGLHMQRSTTSYANLLPAPPTPPSPEDVAALVGAVSTEILTKATSYDNSQFFYDFYSNTLNSYYMGFSGPAYSGPESDPERFIRYKKSTKARLEEFTATGDLAFSGGTFPTLPADLCDFYCFPGTGFLADQPCIPIPSPSNPEDLLCNNVVESAAALNAAALQNLDLQYDASAASANDGYSLAFGLLFQSSIIFVPSRVLPYVIGAFYEAVGKSLATVSGLAPGLVDFNYAPNGLLEMRPLNPLEDTAVMNPIPPFEQWKEEFDTEIGIPGAFDLVFPSNGLPDMLLAIESINIAGVNDEDAPKFFAFLQTIWMNMSSNPFIPLGPNPVEGKSDIVSDCNIATGITICAPVDGYPGVFSSPINDALPCCNPRVPVKNVHFGKGWGYGADPDTTPTTGQPVPFADAATRDSLFTGSKANSVAAFNAKVDELDAHVFRGGDVLYWLRPEEFSPYEPRKLAGQSCGSPEFATDPDVECLSGNCFAGTCVDIRK